MGVYHVSKLTFRSCSLCGGNLLPARLVLLLGGGICGGGIGGGGIGGTGGNGGLQGVPRATRRAVSLRGSRLHYTVLHM